MHGIARLQHRGTPAIARAPTTTVHDAMLSTATVDEAVDFRWTFPAQGSKSKHRTLIFLPFSEPLFGQKKGLAPAQPSYYD
jgi:hypothetical protein